MAQLYSLIDANGETRLLVEISPAPGGTPTLPLALAGAGGLSVAPTTTDDVPGGGALIVAMPADPDQDYPTAFAITKPGGVGGSAFTVDAYGDTRVFLADGSGFEVNNGAANIFEADWNAPTPSLGFFGHTPAAQPVVPLTLPSVQNVITALVALGLVAQHD